MKKIVLLSSFLLITSSFIYAQTITDKIKTAYTSFAKDAQLTYAVSSIIVIDKNTGKIIFAQNENIGLAPASTLKTVTTATSFSILGQDFTYKTPIYINGEIKNGVLKGDVIVVGNGDPTLGSSRYQQTKPELVMNKIVQFLKNKGINAIEGNVIVDDMLWGTEQLPSTWAWEDIGNYYGAGASALVWRENQMKITLNPGLKVGDSVHLKSTEIDIPYLKMKNELLTGAPGSGDQVYAYSGSYHPEIYLRGSYALDLKKQIAISLPDPGWAMVNEIFHFFKTQGIKIYGEPLTSRWLWEERKTKPNKHQEIGVIISPTLKEIVYWINQKSVNIYAEQVLKTIAQNNKSTEEGIKVLKKYWKDKGIDDRSLNLKDGSGLSTANKTTASSMAQILLSANKEPWFNGYYESFPNYNGMKLKSGTIGDGLAYAGYYNNYIIVLIVNNFNGQRSAMRTKMFSLLNAVK
jgi:D-alanyl-D-alanine carboxypeptidase/D-alanyl-D-alanine-endopeptidase (penicillin-binding protein 4)